MHLSREACNGMWNISAPCKRIPKTDERDAMIERDLGLNPTHGMFYFGVSIWALPELPDPPDLEFMALVLPWRTNV